MQVHFEGCRFSIRFSAGNIFLPQAAWLFIFILFSIPAFAQKNFSNLRFKILKAEESWQPLDSLSVIPGSLKISASRDSSLLSAADFELHNNQIKFSKQACLRDSFYRAAFRVFPFDFSAPVARLDTAQRRQAYEGIVFDYNFTGNENRLPDFGKLQYNGNFSRGLSFGNSQNLVLNSALNLQMTGRLTDDVEIQAAITDSSIPLQPEGNTAQLQEFDKVFIQLKRKKSTLIAGDYELARPQSYFMNYFKKLQGATFSNQTDFFKNEKTAGGTLSTRASVAIARGKFARNILAVQEGNQGPYRLRGAEGERFIILLAGTERVFLNGKLLQRGLEADYVIDYNAASITFTPAHLINKDSRIVVEFDYTDQSYLRSLYAADLDYKVEKARVYFSFYSDQDSKNSTLDGELSDADKMALNRAGDNPLESVVSSIRREEEFNALRINYRIVDTVICGQPDTILVFSTDADGALYSARFTEVGEGNGNYTPDETQAANGRVFKWVEPVNCQPQGSFEPVIQLIAPKKQQLMTAGSELNFSKNSSLRAELALSNFDLNRFSALDESDNVGWAGNLLYRHKFQLGDSTGWVLHTEGQYEFVQQHFKALAPYRPQEFVRDWNLSNTQNGQLGNNDLPAAAEQLGQAGFTFEKANWGSWQYRFSGFWRDSIYTGTRHFSRLALSRNGFDAWLENDFLQSNSTFESTRFFRPKFSFEKSFSKNWKAGLYGEREQNRRQANLTDTLSLSSFYYDFFKIFIQKEENQKWSMGAAASRRWDYFPKENTFKANTLADDIELTGAWQQSKTSRLDWNVSYRQLKILDPTLTTQKAGETYLGRLTYDLAAWKGALRSNTSYEIGSGQEPKIEYNYLRVNDGEGVYQWNDYNDDDIPQQNEFEPAVFQDSANFVRVTLLTDEFIRSNNVQFNQSLQLEPRAVWFTKTGFKKMASRFSTLSNLQIQRRVRVAEGVSAWNPFQLSIADSALVALNSSIRNTIFFNRGDAKYDLQINLNENQNRVVVTTGFESRQLSEQDVQARWNLSRSWSLKTKAGRFTRKQDSENFETRDFEIQGWSVEPALTWLQSTSFRATLSFERKDAKNLLPANEQARSDNFAVETTWNFSNKSGDKPSSLRLRATLANVDFEGLSNSPAGFAMLEGLRDGRNFLWNLVFERQVAKNIRLSFNYEGRKTGETRIVHIGRAQVAAVF